MVRRSGCPHSGGKAGYKVGLYPKAVILQGLDGLCSQSLSFCPEEAVLCATYDVTPGSHRSLLLTLPQSSAAHRALESVLSLPARLRLHQLTSPPLTHYNSPCIEEIMGSN